MNLRDASAPVRAIKRLLSHHEIATLLLLLHAPIDVMAAPPDVAVFAQRGNVGGRIRLRGNGVAHSGRVQVPPDR